MRAVFSYITTTTSNRPCEHQYDWNNNNTNIYTAPKHSKVGVRVKATMNFVATKDCLSLFQRRDNSSNNKTDHPIIIIINITVVFISACTYTFTNCKSYLGLT